MNNTRSASNFSPLQVQADSNMVPAYNTNHCLGSNPTNYEQLGSQTNFGNTPYPRPPLSSRPRLTTTLWKDEGTVCYQIDTRGICVARRQDNDMINGTKLLNVTGMSRGKRDGILKNEKGRVVIKAGAMHLKGVWITFDRAKSLATQFKVEDALYPLFAEDPSIFLYSSIYHPLNRSYNDRSATCGSFQPPSIETGFSAVTSSNFNLSRLNYGEKTAKDCSNQPQIEESSILYENLVGDSAKQDTLSFFYPKTPREKPSAFRQPHSRSVDGFSPRSSNAQPSNPLYHPYKIIQREEKKNELLTDFNKRPW